MTEVEILRQGLQEIASARFVGDQTPEQSIAFLQRRAQEALDAAEFAKTTK
jgi:hypothetical protein